jgi:hypothetical protein
MVVTLEGIDGEAGDLSLHQPRGGPVIQDPRQNVFNLLIFGWVPISRGQE